MQALGEFIKNRKAVDYWREGSVEGNQSHIMDLTVVKLMYSLL